jgi:hypothetical protein
MLTIKMTSTIPVRLVYNMGPHHFNEWLQSAIDTYGNIDEIDCRNNQLRSLNIPINVVLNCSYNELVQLIAPEVIYVDCSFNLLTSLYLPKAEYVDCSKNKITLLDVPSVTHLDCSYNNLGQLMSSADQIKCNNNQLINIIAPNATTIICYSNRLEYIKAPKLKYLSYDIYAKNKKFIQIPTHSIKVSDKFYPLSKKLLKDIISNQ